MTSYYAYAYAYTYMQTYDRWNNIASKNFEKKKNFEKFFFWNMLAYTYMQTYDSWNNIPYYTPA